MASFNGYNTFPIWWLCLTYVTCSTEDKNINSFAVLNMQECRGSILRKEGEITAVKAVPRGQILTEGNASLRLFGSISKAFLRTERLQHCCHLNKYFTNNNTKEEQKLCWKKAIEPQEWLSGYLLTVQEVYFLRFVNAVVLKDAGQSLQILSSNSIPPSPERLIFYSSNAWQYYIG